MTHGEKELALDRHRRKTEAGKMNDGPLNTGTPTLRIYERAKTSPAPSPSARKPDAPVPRRSRNELALRSLKLCSRLCPSRCANTAQQASIASSLLNTGFCGQSARQCFGERPRFFVDGKRGRFSISSDFGRNQNYT